MSLSGTSLKYPLKFLLLAVALICSPGLNAQLLEDEPPKHEMRGAWLATVYGIDWPSRQGADAATAAHQRNELIELLDLLQDAGVNAVMFQVRSMCDAMYASSYEPWSRFLTGTRGHAPVKGWDPLEFAVQEAHKRGMELHAWVNPFRLANGPVPEAAKAASGISDFNPAAQGMTISYTESAAPAKKASKGKKKARRAPQPKGKTTTILDPGNPAAVEHILNVCREIITAYDVDGLIFDDYFYPDRLPLGKGYDYPRYIKECVSSAGDTLMSQADWRRANVAGVIRKVKAMIDGTRSEVRFGVSPAGVAGGNGIASGRYGLAAPAQGKDWMFDRIFCDPLQWLDEGSVDYVSPQLYWSTRHNTNPYGPLAQWWGEVARRFNRHCFPSQKVVAEGQSTEAWLEQLEEIECNRRSLPAESCGSILYSTAHLSGKVASGLCEHLKRGPYSHRALMPVRTWAEQKNPGTLGGLRRKGDGLCWQPMGNMRYVVYALPKNADPMDLICSQGANYSAEYIFAVTYEPHVEVPAAMFKTHRFAVAPYDRNGREWQTTELKDK